MNHSRKKQMTATQKKRRKLFFRSFWVSFLLLSSVVVGLFGIAQADQNTRTVGFADTQPAIAVDYHDGRLYLHFFGYEAEWEIGEPLLPRRIWMQPVGQASVHTPQPLHF